MGYKLHQLVSKSNMKEMEAIDPILH